MVAKSILLLAGSMLLASTPAVAEVANDDAVVLRPASQWNLDMGQNKCRIARVFGNGEARTAFYLEQWDPSSTVYWAAAGPDFAKFSDERDTTFSFGPSGDSQKFKFTGVTFGEFGSLIGAASSVAPGSPDAANGDAPASQRDWIAKPYGLPQLDASGARGINSLTISQAGRKAVVLELGDLKAPLSAMNVCMEDLVRYWGFDLDEQRTIVSPPLFSNMDEIVRLVGKTYPETALKAGAQAFFHIRLIVAADGSVEDCVLVNQTLADDFDMTRHPCAIFKRYAKIEPARDAKGASVRSYYANRIVYRTP